jgi:sec-independent protein translocase protein TatB
MFDVGFSEILLILVIALVVLGPDKLPKLAADVGRWVGRARSMARQLGAQLEHEVRLDEMARAQQRAAAETPATPPAPAAAPVPSAVPVPSPSVSSPVNPGETATAVAHPASAPATPNATPDPASAPVGAATHPVSDGKS